MLRIIIAIITLTAACTTKGAAQIVSVGGHYGMLDNTTRRVLVSTTQPDANMPSVYNHNGNDYDVTTTTLPLILLQHEQIVSTEFRQGHLTLIDPNTTADDTPFACPVELRYRGATALAYDKKNYAVKLLDPNDPSPTPQPLDAPLLGMREDNSWILDAMASDCSRLRNRVSTDIWLDFARRPQYADNDAPDMVNGTHGRFVEVFIADRYWGIYCLTEKVDRKQLKLKKYKDGQPRGILYKSYAYNNLRQFVDGDEAPDNTSFTWNNFECSYPDVRKGEPITWQPLFDAITFFAQEMPSFDLRDNLHRYADLPLWIDYNLYIDLIHGDDNSCKNMFVYKRDLNDPNEPFSVCPWDLDATWGRSFNQQELAPTSECQVVNAVNIHLWLSARDQGQSSIDRWAQLRKSDFSTDNIWPYFKRYFDLFRTSGAAARETERWNGINGVHLDFDAEEKYIQQWIPQRLAFLDNDENYKYTDGISTPTIDANTNTNHIYTLDGRIAASCPDGTTPATLHLPAGIYVVNHRKYIAR